MNGRATPCYTGAFTWTCLHGDSTCLHGKEGPVDSFGANAGPAHDRLVMVKYLHWQHRQLLDQAQETKYSGCVDCRRQTNQSNQKLYVLKFNTSDSPVAVIILPSNSPPPSILPEPRAPCK